MTVQVGFEGFCRRGASMMCVNSRVDVWSLPWSLRRSKAADTNQSGRRSPHMQVLPARVRRNIPSLSGLRPVEASADRHGSRRLFRDRAFRSVIGRWPSTFSQSGALSSVPPPHVSLGSCATPRLSRTRGHRLWIIII